MRIVPKNDWPPEHLATLLQLTHGPLPASRIGAALCDMFGVPRSASAVCGKIHRLRLAGAAVGPNWQPGAARARAAAAAAAPRKRKRKKKSAAAAVVAPPPPPPPPSACVEAVHFMDRTSSQCSYPMWGGAERIGLVCGKPVDATSPFAFCEEHRACCLQDVRPR